MQKTIKRRPKLKQKLAEANDLPDWLLQIYADRGLEKSSELDLGLKHLIPVSQFTNAVTAANSLIEHLEKQSTIVIVGDYDVDGAVSSVIVYEVLKACGWESVHYLVPDRFVDGYGLSVSIVDKASELGANLIITVDNGMSSFSGVDHARGLNIDVIITDHHLPASTEPNALHIVNPNARDENFNANNLCGAGVVFYLMVALVNQLDAEGWFHSKNHSKPNLASYLDLVALATIADVVPLDYNNRIIVQEGVKRIRAGHTRMGIKALLQVAKKDYRHIDSQDFGFVIGPRLNAAGRLEDMTIGVECLLSKDMTSAYELASILDDINLQRREIENADKQQALEILNTNDVLENLEQQFSLSLFNENWHQGVVGLVASRLKEQFYKPTVIFAQTENGYLKGSARSIEGFHIKHALDGIVAKYPDLIDKYGGHAMAAGLNIEQYKFPDFCHAFEEAVREHYQSIQPEPVLWTDGELASENINLSSAKLLEQQGPWGNRFPIPVFQGEFELEEQRVVGQKHLKMILRDELNQLHQAIAFNQNELQCQPFATVNTVYELDVNRFRGSETHQLLIRQISTA